MITKTTSKEKGVFRHARVKNPDGTPAWGAQIFAADRVWSLGAFPTEAGASAAFDNAVFYLGVHRGDKNDFNDGSVYKSESFPPPSDRVSQILREIDAWKSTPNGQHWLRKQALKDLENFLEAYGLSPEWGTDAAGRAAGVFSRWVSLKRIV